MEVNRVSKIEQQQNKIIMLGDLIKSYNVKNFFQKKYKANSRLSETLGLMK